MKLKFSRIFTLLIVTLAAALQSFKPGKEDVSFIELKAAPLAVTPSEFYITAVTDARTGGNGIGSLISPQNNVTKSFNSVPIDFKGGVKAIEAFVKIALPANSKLRPVVMKIKNIRVTETPTAGNRVNGEINLTASFSLQGDDDLIHLTDYTGSASYQRVAGPAQQIEPLLRSALTNSLVYFNNWMNIQADKNIVLAKGVNVIFENYSEPEEGDTIYYSANRPLKWTDFQQKTKLKGNHGAEIFASLGYDERVEIVKGVVNVKLSLKVYAPKSACGVRSDVSDEYSLNHEQRHFDIVKLVAERFKQHIAKQKLDPANYDGPINVAYFDALREIDRLQKQYDGETQHSINTHRQQEWGIKIDKELEAFGIKPTSV